MPVRGPGIYVLHDGSAHHWTCDQLEGSDRSAKAQVPKSDLKSRRVETSPAPGVMG